MRNLFCTAAMAFFVLQTGAQPHSRTNTLTAPIITSFTPDTGPAGAIVTITGQNFNATAASNIVYFGAVRANVQGSSSTSIVVTAPAGATCQPISVTNTANGLTSYSLRPFISTFKNPFGTGISVDFYQPPIQVYGGLCSAIADIDGDGKPDLISGGYTNVAVKRNVSGLQDSNITAASFAAPVFLNGVNGPPMLCTVDVDGDGKLDVAVVNYASKWLSVFLNKSTPQNIQFDTAVNFNVSSSYSVAFGDLDDDGKPELVTGNYGSLSILRNTSDPGTLSFAPKEDIGMGVIFSGDADVSVVAIADLDDDGRPDLVSESDGGLLIFKNNTADYGPLEFASYVLITEATGRSVTLSDVDRDGKVDMVIRTDRPLSNQPPGLYYYGIAVLRNITSPGVINASSFEAPVIFRTAVYPFSSVSISDLDGDGRPDLITSNASSISVLRNLSTPGSITSSSFAPNVDFAGGSGHGVSSGDLDGDGIPELFADNLIFKINLQKLVTFSGKVFLQGAFNVDSARMNNKLNSAGILQAKASAQPYNVAPFNYPKTQNVFPIFYQAHPDIVDWVLLELRDSTMPSGIVAAKAAFVQKDGTLVDIDGTNTLISFVGVAPGNYYVAIRHRNHLGIRSAVHIDFTTGTGNYDFTTASTKCYKNQSYTSTIQIGSIWAMRAGDANSSGDVKYNGPANDQNQILNIKLGGSLSTLLTNMYSAEDINMDGTIKWNGPDNDQSFLLNTILSGLLSSIFIEQL